MDLFMVLVVLLGCQLIEGERAPNIVCCFMLLPGVCILVFTSSLDSIPPCPIDSNPFPSMLIHPGEVESQNQEQARNCRSRLEVVPFT